MYMINIKELKGTWALIQMFGGNSCLFNVSRNLLPEDLDKFVIDLWWETANCLCQVLFLTAFPSSLGIYFEGEAVNQDLDKIFQCISCVHKLIRSECSSMFSEPAFQSDVLALFHWSLSEQILKCWTAIECFVNIAGFGLYSDCQCTMHKKDISQNILWSKW